MALHLHAVDEKACMSRASREGGTSGGALPPLLQAGPRLIAFAIHAFASTAASAARLSTPCGLHGLPRLCGLPLLPRSYCLQPLRRLVHGQVLRTVDGEPV